MQPLDLIHFPLWGQRVIEASAGTGKTFTMAALYLRLILGDPARFGDDESFSGGQNAPNFATQASAGLLPQNILVVTFTEAATAELRARIRARLVEAVAAFRDEDKLLADDFLRDWRAQFPQETWRAQAFRLDLAAQWIDEAEISTIHSFCYKTLARFAFESGYLFQQNVLLNETPLRQLVVRDFWRRCLVTLSALHFARAREILGNDPDAILEKMQPLQVLNHLDLAKLRQRLCAKFAKFAAPAKHDFSGGQNAKNNSANDFAAWANLPELSAILAQEAQALAQLKQTWQAIDWASLPELLALLVKQKALKGQSFSSKMRDKLAADLQAWQDNDDFALPNLSEKTWEKFEDFASCLQNGATMPAHEGLQALATMRQQWQETRADESVLALAFLWIHAAIWQHKAARAELGFDDMISALAAALSPDNPEHAHLAALLRQQFPVALIDEFQDTDRVQYQIFKAIYGGQNERRDYAFLLVGDPKQSIYAFRGAQIDTYLSARRDSETPHFTLGKNYRSSVAMVDALNHLFVEAETATGAAFAEADLPFHAVKAKGRDDVLCWQNRPVPAVNFAFLDGLPSSAVYQNTMALAAAAQIDAWLAASSSFAFCDKAGQVLRRVLPKDIAILVRSSREAASMRQALRARGLRSVYLSERDSVWASDEAWQVLTCLRAVAFDDEARIREALACPCFGWSWEKLARLTDDEDFREQVLLRFRDYRRLWQRRGVLAMLRQLWFDENVPALCLPMARGERVLTNLLHLAELAQAEAQNSDGEAGLIRRLEQLMRDADPSSTIRLESEEDLVRIITIHKAKGLEFAVVMLPFISNFRAGFSAKQSLFLWQAQDARHFALKQHADENAKQAYLSAEMREATRLLYVALTRAQHHLWLGTAALVRGAGKMSNMHEGSFGRLLNHGAPMTAEFLAEKLSTWAKDYPECFAFSPLQDVALPTFSPEPVVAEMRLRARVFTKHLRQAWSVSSYSAILPPLIFAEKTPSLANDASFSGGQNVAPNPKNQDELARAAFLPTAAHSALGDEVFETTAFLPKSRSLHDFAAGPQAGIFLHGILEWAANEGFARVLQHDAALLKDVLARRCQRRDWQDWAADLAQFFQQFLQQDFALGQRPFALQHLTAGKYLAEMPFTLGVGRLSLAKLDALVLAHILPQAPRGALNEKILQGLFKGYIDLVFEHGGQFFVADYKSNRLGADDAAYDQERMVQVFLAHRYDLQGVFYVLALHRLLKSRRVDYDYDRDMGGFVFFFLRACAGSTRGMFHVKPPRVLIETLDQLFWVSA